MLLISLRFLPKPANCPDPTNESIPRKWYKEMIYLQSSLLVVKIQEKYPLIIQNSKILRL